MGGSQHGDEPETADDSIRVSVDRSEPYSRLVIADESSDERWLSIRESEAPVLSAWR